MDVTSKTMVPYDHIDSLVKVHNDALLVNNGNSGYRPFGKHVDDIKDGCIETRSGDGIVRVLPFRDVCRRRRVDICANLELAQRKM